MHPKNDFLQSGVGILKVSTRSLFTNHFINLPMGEFDPHEAQNTTGKLIFRLISLQDIMLIIFWAL